MREVLNDLIFCLKKNTLADSPFKCWPMPRLKRLKKWYFFMFPAYDLKPPTAKLKQLILNICKFVVYGLK